LEKFELEKTIEEINKAKMEIEKSESIPKAGYKLLPFENQEYIKN